MGRAAHRPWRHSWHIEVDVCPWRRWRWPCEDKAHNQRKITHIDRLIFARKSVTSIDAVSPRGWPGVSEVRLLKTAPCADARHWRVVDPGHYRSVPGHAGSFHWSLKSDALVISEQQFYGALGILWTTLPYSTSNDYQNITKASAKTNEVIHFGHFIFRLFFNIFGITVIKFEFSSSHVFDGASTIMPLEKRLRLPQMQQFLLLISSCFRWLQYNLIETIQVFWT